MGTHLDQVSWDAVWACGFIFFNVEQEFQNPCLANLDFGHWGELFGGGAANMLVGDGEYLSEESVKHVGFGFSILNQCGT